MPSRPPPTTACTRSRGRILRDGYAAEDAVQDALVRAWRDLWGLRDPAAFDAWLHRLLVTPATIRSGVRAGARSTLPECRRSSATNRATTSRSSPIATRSIAPSVELSVDHRAVVVLTHYAGLTGPEVGRDPCDPGRGPSLLDSTTRSAPCAPDRSDRSTSHRPQRGARPMNLPHDRAVVAWLRPWPRSRVRAESLDSRTRGDASDPDSARVGRSPKGGSRCSSPWTGLRHASDPRDRDARAAHRGAVRHAPSTSDRSGAVPRRRSTTAPSSYAHGR